IERTGCFARGRAYAAGELGKIVGLVQDLDCAPPVLAIDQIIPVRNDVIDRATGHAERNTAVHAARTLYACLIIRQTQDKFLVVLDALLDWCTGLGQTLVFEETGNLAHY